MAHAMVAVTEALAAGVVMVPVATAKVVEVATEWQMVHCTATSRGNGSP